MRREGMRKIKAVLFDLDGVLVDSFHAWMLAFNAMLRKFGRNELSEEEFRERCWGPDLKENLAEFGLDDDAGEYCMNVQKDLIDHIKLFPDARDVLHKLKECNIKTGLVTNTPRENTLLIINQFNLRFDAVVTRDDVRVGKPNAEMILKCCEMLGVYPKDAMFVGDTESDFIAGRNAGCITVGINANGADITIQRLHEIIIICCPSQSQSQSHNFTVLQSHHTIQSSQSQEQH